MEVHLREITGNWDRGFALAKHTKSSVFLGYNASGHPQFDNTRSEPGEALYQLKYQQDYQQVGPLAAQIQTSILPLFEPIGLIVPMPASNVRARQPVNEIAIELGRLTGIVVFEDIITKTAATGPSAQLKNMMTKEEKAAALAGRFVINDAITNKGHWNALIVDDLFHTGASMEAACSALRTYHKIAKIYVAAITWR